MEKIKRLLLYAGATPEEFAQVQQEMHLYNYNRLVAFLAISIVFLLISAVYAVFSVVLAPNLPAYLIVLGISCLLLPITLYVGRRSRAGLQICLSLFLSSLYSLSIYLSTVTSPGGPATAFIAFLLTLPTLFILPPLENMCSVVIWDMLFFLFVSVSKDARIVQIDMLNGIIYGCISIIASTYVMHMVIRISSPVPGSATLRKTTRPPVCATETPSNASRMIFPAAAGARSAAFTWTSTACTS